MEIKLELRSLNTLNYYEVLGVKKRCSKKDIVRAFRLKARLHHPDKHFRATDMEKKYEEEMFKEVLFVFIIRLLASAFVL